MKLKDLNRKWLKYLESYRTAELHEHGFCAHGGKILTEVQHACNCKGVGWDDWMMSVGSISPDEADMFIRAHHRGERK